MKGLDTGKDKVKKICDVLKRETLEPAKKEAEEIVLEAKSRAEKIIKLAEKEAEKMHLEARAEIEKNKAIFQSSLSQASKQAIELLKQEIEEKLFNKELRSALAKGVEAPKVIADLINAVVKALEKEGLDVDLSAYVSSSVPAHTVNSLLAQNILDKLREKSVLLCDNAGGIEVKLHHENMTIDVSLDALREVVAQYIRKDFRALFFGQK
ncbi:MAG: V-type ATP synthase subunit E [Chlamydiota bacterium]